MTSDVAEYLDELAARLEDVLRPDLVGVYAGGSYALGAYEPGRSDLDVAAVVRAPLDAARKDAVVARVRSEALPCPARMLELVLYRLDLVRTGTVDAAFELNLNSGAGFVERVDHWADPGETHWFPIDRSILASAGVTVLGPPAAEVFAPIPRARLLPVVEAALRWHLGGEVRGDDAVLNACRAWRFAAEGVWSSKRGAGRWALARRPLPLVEAALAERGSAGQLEAAAVRAFVEAVLADLRGTGR